MTSQERIQNKNNINQQITNAWLEIIKTGQLDRYYRLSALRVEQLKEGVNPEAGEEVIALYLRALVKWLRTFPEKGESKNH